MSRRIIDILTAAGVVTFVFLTLEVGLRLMAFDR